MQKCLLLILLYILIFSQVLYASAIKATVLEKETNEPLTGANISLYKTTDTTDAVEGTVTDLNGVFEFENVTPDKYKIVISFIGFKSHVIQNISVVNDVDLGTIYLEPKDILMESVIVEGKKEIITNTLEKKIYNVDKDIISQSGSASELLQNIPSVTVDIDGNVTLRNSGNITFSIYLKILRFS